MTHYMKLHADPFERISSGAKTLELRLYDEKRRAVKPGDCIVFSPENDCERTVKVKVKALHRFASFKELYSSVDLSALGYAENEISPESYTEMDAYYPAEKQSLCGVVGIEIEKV